MPARGAKGTADHGGNGGFGGAIAGRAGDSSYRLTVVNSTFCHNSHGSGEFPGEGVAVYLNSDHSSIITNSIFWNNPGTDFVRVGTTQVTYSDIGGGNYVGEGIIDQDPLLDADLVPQAGSPCIDAANDTVAPISDLLGHGRQDEPSVRQRMALYGGFASGETYRDERDWARNETVLSGRGQITVVSCYNLNGCGADTILDGFSITKGRGEKGGGMAIGDASPTIANCVFSNNSATSLGGGLYNKGGSPKIIDCVFSGNTAGVRATPRPLA